MKFKADLMNDSSQLRKKVTILHMTGEKRGIISLVDRINTDRKSTKIIYFDRMEINKEALQLISLEGNRQVRCWMYHPERSSLFEDAKKKARVSASLASEVMNWMKRA